MNASFVSLHGEQVPKLGTIRISLRSSIVDSTLIMAREREAIFAANIAAMMLTEALVSANWIVNLAIHWFEENILNISLCVRIKVHLEHILCRFFCIY